MHFLIRFYFFRLLVHILWGLDNPVRPVIGRAHPNTDKWLFQKWFEVLTATLPNEPVSGDEELYVLSNSLLASPLGEEVKTKRSNHLIRRWSSLRLPLRPPCHGRR